jgi:hypothetical protein
MSGDVLYFTQIIVDMFRKGSGFDEFHEMIIRLCRIWRKTQFSAIKEPFFARGVRRGREGSYPPSPRTNPGVRNYRTGLFRDTRFRMAADLAEQ